MDYAWLLYFLDKEKHTVMLKCNVDGDGYDLDQMTDDINRLHLLALTHNCTYGKVEDGDDCFITFTFHDDKDWSSFCEEFLKSKTDKTLGEGK